MIFQHFMKLISFLSTNIYQHLSYIKQLCQSTGPEVALLLLSNWLSPFPLPWVWRCWLLQTALPSFLVLSFCWAQLMRCIRRGIIWGERGWIICLLSPSLSDGSSVLLHLKLHLPLGGPPLLPLQTMGAVGSLLLLAPGSLFIPYGFPLPCAFFF